MAYLFSFNLLHLDFKSGDFKHFITFTSKSRFQLHDKTDVLQLCNFE